MTLTVRQLEEHFYAWLGRQVDAGRRRPRTVAYYRSLLRQVLDQVGRERPCAALVRFDGELVAASRCHLQALKRLFAWGVEMELISRSPFVGIPLPPLGQRQRILTRPELARLLRNSGRPLRWLLLGMRHTLARPQEVRGLRLSDWREDLGAFVLSDFKGRDRRRDGVRVRVLPADAWMRRLVARRARRLDRGGVLFPGGSGQPWTSNALRLAVRRAAARAGLDAEGEERVVAYTLRHTVATWATAAGVRDRQLADIMGHTSTRTTARYQHLPIADLVAAIGAATGRRAS